MTDLRKQRFGFKQEILRDETWIKHLRTERCLFTGQYASENDAVDPFHIGSYGRSMKSPDNEVLPILHSLHVLSHNSGEVSFLRNQSPDDVLREAFRALARQHYLSWKK